MRIAENVHLDGILDRIKVPFLVTHGEKDSQIPLHWAQRTYEQLVNSPKRELKIFTAREGGVQHSSFDNSANAGAFSLDDHSLFLIQTPPAMKGCEHFTFQVEYDADMDLHDRSWVAREVPINADSSQLFLFQQREKWSPGGPPRPGEAH